MTMAEAKSIETTLIKISVRTLWFIASGLVIAVVYATMCYNDIMSSQAALLQAIKDQGKDTQFEIKDIRKDVYNLDQRLVKIEKP